MSSIREEEEESLSSQASFGSWKRDFEDTGSQSGDDSGWWSDDGDETSKEGSDFSEDSAGGANLNRSMGPEMGGREDDSGYSHSKERGGVMSTGRSKNKYTSDPLAFRVALGGGKSVEEEEQDESVLKSNNAANCADTDVFKMIVEMLLGSPSGLFSDIAEHVVGEGDISSFLQSLESKPALFQTTGLLDDVHFQYLGKGSSSRFLAWFIETASEVSLCRKFVDLGEQDLITLSSNKPGSWRRKGVLPDGGAGSSEGALMSLIDSLKTGVHKLVSNFESDVGRLEIEHNSLVKEAAPQAGDGTAPNPFSAAAATFQRQQAGAATFLGRGNSFQLSKSLLSLYSVCEVWQPVLRSCNELTKSLMVVVHEHRTAYPLASISTVIHTRTSQSDVTQRQEHQAAVESLSTVCLALVQAVDTLIRATQMELASPSEQSSGPIDSHNVRVGGMGKENLMQLRLRELRASLSPGTWFSAALQEDIFPASMGYFRKVCEAVQALVKVQAHGRVEHSVGSGSRDVQSLPGQDASLDYPAEHTLSSPGAGAGQRGSGAREADIHALFRPFEYGLESQRRLRSALPMPMPSSESKSDGATQPPTQWHLSSVYEEHSNEAPAFRSLSGRQKAAWEQSVQEFERRMGDAAHAKRGQEEQEEGRQKTRSSSSSSSLPAMSLLQVTVLQSNLRTARRAELQRTTQLWSRLRLHRRFEALQKVYFLGDESVFRDFKGLVFTSLDVPSARVHSSLDMRTRVRRQLSSTHSSSTIRLHLASSVEDRIKTLLDAAMEEGPADESGSSYSGNGSGGKGTEETQMFFNVSLGSGMVSDEGAGAGAGAGAGGDESGQDALSLLRLAAHLSIQVRCTTPLSLILSEPLCLCYESTLGFLMALSACRWVCESVRVASKASLVGLPHLPRDVPPETIAARTFKKDCHVTLGLLLHMVGAIRGTLQVMAHQASDHRHYVDGRGHVPWAVDELRSACEYMLREVVRVFALLQPAIVSLTTSAVLFAGKYRSLLAHAADLPGPHSEAFQLHAQASSALQAQLLATKRAMRGFLLSLDAIIKGGRRGGPRENIKYDTCLVQLRDKLRTLFPE